MAKPSVPNIQETVRSVTNFLERKHIPYHVDDYCAEQLQLEGVPTCRALDIGHKSDLLIVVGGDGSLLNAARRVARDGTPVLGINRGRLGFLTDISPESIPEHLEAILAGQYIEEQRRMLKATIIRQAAPFEKAIALNDVVLYSGEIARMIEFEIWVDGVFVCSHRSDGLITSTPTGSTAYALSGGGPILHPALNAVVLVPMHPHTLSARPLVLSGDSVIEIRISADTDHVPLISCDGHVHLKTALGDTIRIEPLEKTLRLIHPTDHEYFSVLRNKLNWSARSA